MADKKKELSPEQLDEVNGGLIIEYEKQKSGRTSYAIADENTCRILTGGPDLESTIRMAEEMGADTTVQHVVLKNH